MTKMASPTAASTAATVMMKKTNTEPSMEESAFPGSDEDQVHGVEHQLDAHEDHDHVSPQDRTDGPDRKEDAAEDASSSSEGISWNIALSSLLSLGDDHRAHDAHQKQDRSDLEGEQVLAVEQRADRLHVADAVHRWRPDNRRSSPSSGRRAPRRPARRSRITVISAPAILRRFRPARRAGVALLAPSPCGPA